MNERGLEVGNPAVTEGRSLPWLQDIDADNDGTSDNWLNSWDYAYRDVVIVDSNNVPLEVYNLTSNDLADVANRDDLKQQLITAAQSVATDDWTNPVDPLDVNNDSFVSPLDALLILNELNSVGPHELGTRGEQDAYLDPSGDQFVSPIDALLVINRLNELSSVSQAATPVAAVAASVSPTPTRTAASLFAAAIDEALAEEADDPFKKDALRHRFVESQAI